MIDPAWFFSTLAQATAASIGFVIAFSAAAYTSQRARKQERVNRFKDDMREFRTGVNNVIKEMICIFEELGEFERNTGIYRQDILAVNISTDIKEWANNQKTSQLAYVWCNLRWLDRLLIVIREDTDPDEMMSHFRALEYPILNLLVTFETMPNEHIADPPPWEQLYTELTHWDESTPDVYSPKHPVFEQNPTLDVYIKKNIINQASSSTLHGWTKIVESISDTYYTIDARKYLDSKLFENNVVGPVLNTCKILFATGVILPTLFLLTFPESQTSFMMPTFIITIAQISNIVVVGYFSWILFDDLIKLVQMNEF